MSNTRNIVIVAIVAGALLYLSQQPGVINELTTIFDQLTQWFDTTTIAKIYQAYTCLGNAGLSVVQAKLALCAVMFETGAFSSLSTVADTDNNYTGIEWINNPSVQLNASQGTPFPASESSTAYYAHFATVQDWANDYVRILNLPPQQPIDNATDPNSFALLLEENGYYTGSETDYAGGLTHYWNIFTAIGL
jgi:hypothetical protein